MGAECERLPEALGEKLFSEDSDKDAPRVRKLHQGSGDRLILNAGLVLLLVRHELCRSLIVIET